MANTKRGHDKRASFFLALLLCFSSLPADAATARPSITFQFEDSLSATQAFCYLAQARGLYKAAGVDVRIVPGIGPGSSIQSVGSGKADIGAADMMDVLAARARGTPLLIIATMGDRNPACVFSKKSSGITTAADLSGKRIGVDPFNRQNALFPLFSQGAGIQAGDVTLVPLSYAQRILALAAGTVDGILGTLQEREELRSSMGGDQLEALLWADNGFTPYGMCLFIRRDSLSAKSPALRSFLSASFKAWALALKNPDQAAAALGMYRPISHDQALMLADGLADLVPLFDTPAYRTRGIGTIDEVRLGATLDALPRYEGVPVSFTPADAFTRVLLPAAPVKMPPVMEPAPQASTSSP